jgi:RNA polymerase sigma-70 factor (ECF subfamily)
VTAEDTDKDLDALDRDDARLIGELVRGNTAALGTLYDRHAARLLWIALSATRSRVDAEDVVHDVFLEAWKRAADYDPARGTVRRWLGIRAWSRAIDRVTQLRDRRAALQEAWSAAIDDTGALAANASDDVYVPDSAGASVHRLLAMLRPDQHQLLALLYIGGLTTGETARLLGVPVGTVKSRLSAALAKLRALLADR